MAKTLAETIEQIKKLQALATSSNIHEAMNATLMANRLIDRYRLTQADLEIESSFQEPIIQDTEYLAKTGKVTMWKQKLIHTLTRHYGVAYFNDVDYSGGRAVTQYRMIGRKSDLDIVRYMYTWLLMECERLSLKEARGQGRVFVASYQEGFVTGVTEQLNLSRAELKKESTSTSIVKIDARYEESKEKMYDLIPGLRNMKAKSSRRLDAGAFGMGQQRGKSIHLGGAMSNGAGVRMLRG